MFNLCVTKMAKKVHCATLAETCREELQFYSVAASRRNFREWRINFPFSIGEILFQDTLNYVIECVSTENQEISNPVSNPGLSCAYLSSLPQHYQTLGGEVLSILTSSPFISKCKTPPATQARHTIASIFYVKLARFFFTTISTVHHDHRTIPLFNHRGEHSRTANKAGSENSLGN